MGQLGCPHPGDDHHYFEDGHPGQRTGGCLQGVGSTLSCENHPSFHIIFWNNIITTSTSTKHNDKEQHYKKESCVPHNGSPTTFWFCDWPSSLARSISYIYNACCVSRVLSRVLFGTARERREICTRRTPLVGLKRKEDKELLSCRVYSVDNLTTLVVAKSCATRARSNTKHTHTHKGHTVADFGNYRSSSPPWRTF